jgi:CO/xanthine dehydrogenase FAD-binding subunit
MAVKNYHRPTELPAAAELVKAGAVPLMLGPRPPLEIEAEAVVDLSQLGLSYIREEADGLHIGALTPLQEIAASPLVRTRANGILSQAAELSAHLGLRHIATLGGALLTDDGPPEVRLALHTLNVHLRFLDSAQKEISFFEWQDNPAGVVSGVRLPNNPLRLSSALERIARSPKDQALLAVAVVLAFDGEQIPNWRFAIGQNPRLFGETTSGESPITTVPQLKEYLNEFLQRRMNAESDYLASAEYRREMAMVLIHRAIEKALKLVNSVE